jgi:hypothetical protein
MMNALIIFTLALKRGRREYVDYPTTCGPGNSKTLMMITDNLKLKIVAYKVIAAAAKGGKMQRKKEPLKDMTGYRGIVGPLARINYRLTSFLFVLSPSTRGLYGGFP